MDERAIEFLKTHSTEAETRVAWEVPGVYSVLAIKIVGQKVVGFDRVELRHVITAERRKEGLRYGSI